MTLNGTFDPNFLTSMPSLGCKDTNSEDTDIYLTISKHLCFTDKTYIQRERKREVIKSSR